VPLLKQDKQRDSWSFVRRSYQDEANSRTARQRSRRWHTFVRFLKLDNDQRRLSSGAVCCDACTGRWWACLVVVRRADFIEK
jgi:hypothetical protein